MKRGEEAPSGTCIKGARSDAVRKDSDIIAYPTKTPYAPIEMQR